MFARIVGLTLKIALVMAFLIGGSFRLEWTQETSLQTLNKKLFNRPVPMQMQAAVRFRWPTNAPDITKPNAAGLLETIGWLVTQGLWQRWGQLIYIGPYQAKIPTP
jgi:hypothetical protein